MKRLAVNAAGYLAMMAAWGLLLYALVMPQP